MSAADAAAEDPFIIEWHGYTATGHLDVVAHDYQPEHLVFHVQQAGFLVDIPAMPLAIETSVTWHDPAARFMLHPHYKAENDPALGGNTQYYGYPSAMTSGGFACVRVPASDLAAGTWPMMVHPSSDATNVPFTITVAILGASGTVLDDMHGHRMDGPSPVDDRAVDACELLGGPR